MTKSSLLPKRDIAAQVIGRGGSNTEAAQKVNVTPQTISVWVKDPAFEARINECQLDCFNEAQARFKHLAGEAVTTFEDLLKNSKSDKVKLEAAKFILKTIQIFPGDCPAILTIGETTEAEIIRKQKLDKAKTAQSKMFEENSIIGLSSYM